MMIEDDELLLAMVMMLRHLRDTGQMNILSVLGNSTHLG